MYIALGFGKLILIPDWTHSMQIVYLNLDLWDFDFVPDACMNQKRLKINNIFDKKLRLSKLHED